MYGAHKRKYIAPNIRVCEYATELNVWEPYFDVR